MRAILVLAGMCLPLAAAAEPADKKRLLEALEQAVRWDHDGRIVELADRLIALEPRVGRHHYVRGYGLFAQHRFHEATPEFEIAATLGMADGESGARLPEGPQLKPPQRDYIPGDAVLARGASGRVFEPAMMLRREGDTAHVRFYWGGQERVPYATHVRPFDWKRGLRVRCRLDGDARQDVRIEAVKADGLLVSAGGAPRALPFDRCEDAR